MTTIETFTFRFPFVAHIVIVRHSNIVYDLILKETDICNFSFLSLEFHGNLFTQSVDP